MNIKLYKCKSPFNKVNKTNDLSLETIFESVIFFEEDTLSIINPSILLKISNDCEDMAKYNYCYIPKFNRYYWIDNMTAENGLVRINCSCDVLMSFKTDIYASTQYVLRSQLKRSPYLVDNQIPIRSDKAYVQTVFGDNVDKKDCGRIILETTGKGGRVVP